MVFCSREVLQLQPQYDCINLHEDTLVNLYLVFSLLFLHCSKLIVSWILGHSANEGARMWESIKLLFFSLSLPYACSFHTTTQCLLRKQIIANSNKNAPIRLIRHVNIFYFWGDSFSVSTICHTSRFPHMNRKIEIFIENQNKSTRNERVRHLFWICFLAT